MKLPQYSGKDYIIMLWTLIPFTIVLNSIALGKAYFSSLSVFLVATIIGFGLMTVSFVLYGGVAVAFRNRLPEDRQLMKRMAIVISLFIIMTGLFISGLFKIYESIPLLNFTFSEGSFFGAYGATVVLNIFLTVLHEGVSRFEKYKATLIETEQLKKEYMQSQLLGLKSQVNPHFLFNGLNSLSSLISEDPEKAEQFLDEMSKVYRYLLRNDEEQLVTLQTELQFIDSYYYLLKVRYGDGVFLETDVPAKYRQERIPPLTLQMLFENAFSLNTVSKEQPLTIEIRSHEDGWLEVRNNIQLKVGSGQAAVNEGLENIVNKFRLLCQQTVTIEDNNAHRVIRLPLLPKEEMSPI
jgi:two-component system, LytTR family, sensor kinase